MGFETLGTIPFTRLTGPGNKGQWIRTVGRTKIDSKFHKFQMENPLDSSKQRRYLETHPWIDFRADLGKAPYTLWMQLGEACSKCQHIAGVPLRPEVAQNLYAVYLSKGVHATTSIEGNTLTEEQVYQRIVHKLKVPKSQQYLTNEVDNIIQACNEIGDKLLRDPHVKITPELIRRYNALVLKGIPVEEGVVPGEYRTYPVGVMTYRGAPWEDCPYLVERLCEWLNGPDFDSPDPEIRFALTVFKAILAHIYIAWIHPFGDGNGRTARLIEFQILVQSGMAPYPAGHLLSNHYNKTRADYYRMLDKSSKPGGGVVPFIEYAVQGFVDGLREQLIYIRNQQWKVTWENYVHELFRGKDTPACARQKHLALDMPDRVTPRKELPTVSTRVAGEYGGKGEKTLTRDLNTLLKMGLIVRRGKGFAPNRDLILAFLPPRCEEAPEPRNGFLF
jgi:Fic family protein